MQIHSIIDTSEYIVQRVQRAVYNQDSPCLSGSIVRCIWNGRRKGCMREQREGKEGERCDSELIVQSKEKTVDLKRDVVRTGWSCRKEQIEKEERQTPDRVWQSVLWAWSFNRCQYYVKPLRFFCFLVIDIVAVIIGLTDSDPVGRHREEKEK